MLNGRSIVVLFDPAIIDLQWHCNSDGKNCRNSTAAKGQMDLQRLFFGLLQRFWPAAIVPFFCSDYLINSDVLNLILLLNLKNTFFKYEFPLKMFHEPIDTSNDLVVMCKKRRSKRTREKKNYGNNFLTYIVEDEHVSYYDAIKFIDAPLWLEAFKKLLDYV